MRILVIDDESDFRKLVWWSLSTALGDVEVIELDPARQPRPQDGFDWSRYDVVLLDDDLGQGQQGLAWLEALSTHDGFPPTVLMTDDELIAVRAVRLGVAACLRKTEVSTEQLVEAVQRAIDSGANAEAAAAPTGAEADAQPRPRRAPHRPPPRVQGSGVLPQPIRGYHVLGQIGEGGTAKVYLAEREDDGRTEVLKIIDIQDVDDGSVLERFVQEAEIISRLRSPHVVTIHRQGFTDHYAFLSMELLSGGDLKEQIASGMDYATALSNLRQIAHALDAIHNAGIVHRDLKPGNLMFRDSETLVLADFGIAKRLSSDATFTHVGHVIGTPYYMSPEQARGATVDARSDVYSVGAIFYEMLTGRRPYLGRTPIEVIEQHLHAEIPTLPPEMQRWTPLLDRLLAKAPADRFQNAGEILYGLETLI